MIFLDLNMVEIVNRERWYMGSGDRGHRLIGGVLCIVDMLVMLVARLITSWLSANNMGRWLL